MKHRGLFSIFFVGLVLLSISAIIPINPDSEKPQKSLYTVIKNQIYHKTNDIKVTTTILLTGDVMLGRTVMTRSLDQNNPEYPLEKVAQTLKSADLVFINLENPIISGCKRDYDSLTFCADPSMIQALTNSGVDIVTLANNHSRNYGEEGLKQTIKLLGENNISATVDGSLVVKKIHDFKFGFMGVDFLTREPDENTFKLIKLNADKVDILIVGVHWGQEYTAEPTASQRLWAKSIADSGASVIVGHHPHWIQTVDHINAVPVFYSLGNLVFDQMWSEETRKSLVVKLTYENGKLINEEFLPTYIKNWAQPEFVE